MMNHQIQIPECMRHLPTYQGLPVPYVAIWSAERIGPAIDWTPIGIKPIKNPQYLRLNGGILWLDGPDNRQGTPVFGGTHSSRQRRCMRHGICQVCGRKQNPKNLLWVIPHAEDQQTLHDEYGMIINPPTCPDCFRGALRLCPHLIKFGAEAKVYKGTARIAGVHGTYVFEGNRTEIIYIRMNEESKPAFKFIMGRQYMIELQDEVEVDVKEYLTPA